MQPGDAFRLVIDKHMEIFAIEELLLINRFDSVALTCNCIIRPLLFQFLMELNQLGNQFTSQH
ncbi:Uncharacterised protein [Salmonella enterica subsp. arizonae]|uniref:Uncharacterized protein n=1 Tax=Salmonella enterica subsp. arizonae TaxID=59203 RepID=A0A379SJL2_SALER|nr:Uncharacterised protein [Salmonella enterica subsp. arizonae]